MSSCIHEAYPIAKRIIQSAWCRMPMGRILSTWKTDCAKIVKSHWKTSLTINESPNQPRFLLIILSQEFHNNHTEPKIQSKLSSLYIQLSKNWKGLFLGYAPFWCTLKNGLLESKHIKNKKSPLKQSLHIHERTSTKWRIKNLWPDVRVWTLHLLSWEVTQLFPKPKVERLM